MSFFPRLMAGLMLARLALGDMAIWERPLAIVIVLEAVEQYQVGF